MLPRGLHALAAKIVGCLWSLGLGMAPLAAWLGFSTFYYGFPFPNTAYAKLNNGSPFLGVGAARLLAISCISLETDPLTLATIAAGLGFAFWLQSRVTSVLPRASSCILLYVAALAAIS